MLFQKTIKDLTIEDLTDFCSRFEEGIRVEYKRNFGEDVRKKIPKIVSSFANSYGGVLVLGVETHLGKPDLPIKGFDRPEKEEIRLTIQNACRQGINPAIFPDIVEVPCAAKDRILVVISVEESVEAPHAIENRCKVYVRTGDSSDPYDLSDIQTIELLLRRKHEPLERKKNSKTLRKRDFSDR